MWNRSVSLPIKNKVNEDEDGFENSVEYEYIHVPASITEVTRNDEILANQSGYSVDLNVEIMDCNYTGQSFLVDDATGDFYNIKRHYRKNKSMKITLTCAKGERDGKLFP